MESVEVEVKAKVLKNNIEEPDDVDTQKPTPITMDSQYESMAESYHFFI